MQSLKDGLGSWNAVGRWLSEESYTDPTKTRTQLCDENRLDAVLEELACDPNNSYYRN